MFALKTWNRCKSDATMQTSEPTSICLVKDNKILYTHRGSDSFTAFQAALCASIGSDPASGVIQKAIPVIDVVHELEAEQDGHFDVGEVPVVKAERAQYRRARDLADKFAHFDDEILKILRNTNLLNANLKPSNQIPQEKPLFIFSNRV